MWQTISYVSTASTSLNNSDMAELFEFVKLKNNNLQITLLKFLIVKKQPHHLPSIILLFL